MGVAPFFPFSFLFFSFSLKKKIQHQARPSSSSDLPTALEINRREMRYIRSYNPIANLLLEPESVDAKGRNGTTADESRLQMEGAEVGDEAEGVRRIG